MPVYYDVDVMCTCDSGLVLSGGMPSPSSAAARALVRIAEALPHAIFCLEQLPSYYDVADARKCAPVRTVEDIALSSYGLAYTGEPTVGGLRHSLRELHAQCSATGIQGGVRSVRCVCATSLYACPDC